jgi:hypothetical protein
LEANSTPTHHELELSAATDTLPDRCSVRSTQQIQSLRAESKPRSVPTLSCFFSDGTLLPLLKEKGTYTPLLPAQCKAYAPLHFIGGRVGSFVKPERDSKPDAGLGQRSRNGQPGIFLSFGRAS